MVHWNDLHKSFASGINRQLELNSCSSKCFIYPV